MNKCCTSYATLVQGFLGIEKYSVKRRNFSLKSKNSWQKCTSLASQQLLNISSTPPTLCKFSGTDFFLSPHSWCCLIVIPFPSVATDLITKSITAYLSSSQGGVWVPWSSPIVSGDHNYGVVHQTPVLQVDKHLECHQTWGCLDSRHTHYHIIHVIKCVTWATEKSTTVIQISAKASTQ